MEKRIAIITINYNTENLLEKLINCLVVQDYVSWKLIIVNNSPDNIKINKVIKNFEDKRIILAGINKNLGYSKGNNLGFKYALDEKLVTENDLILFTNEDILIDDRQFLSKAVRNIEYLNCGFLGPRIINNDGSYMLPHLEETNYMKCLLHIGNNGRVDKLFRINSKLKKIKKPLEVFLLNGACFFCRVNDFIKVNMFDTNTFIYYEEELLFRRAFKKGIKTFYIPAMTVFHEHSASIKRSFSILKKKKFVYDAEIYFITKILKVNSLLKVLFRIERFFEFFFLRLFLSFNHLIKK